MTDRILPDAAWRNAPGLMQVVAALRDEMGGPRFVGGAVRDSLLGLDGVDVDLATALVPEAIIDRLEAARIKAVPTGLDHGTVTAVAEGKNYEITTLRRDVETDGRRAKVLFSTDWREDAARRDFTINALYADPETGAIYDYFGGLADLDAGIVRFIGNADERIAEDYLRIMRFFRFFARYGRGEADADAIAACARGANGLTALSRERIAQELSKLLLLPQPVAAIGLMIENGIFAPFLPELDAQALSGVTALVKREQEFAQPISLAARLLALLPKDAACVDRVAARLKLSNRLRESLAKRVSSDAPTAENIRALAYHQGSDCARDIAMLYAEDGIIADCLRSLSGWEAPIFPLKGGQLIDLGLATGPEVARTLRAIETDWIAAGFPDAEVLQQIATQRVKTALSASRNANATSADNGRAK